MNERDQRANNLVSRLFAYAPREGREPLEDYCTEALAWCLLTSPELMRRFLNLTGIVALRDRASLTNVRTQVSFDGNDSDNPDDNLDGDRFDLVIESEGATPFVLVVESKVGSGFRPNQLQKYRRRLKVDNAFPGISIESRYLVTLTTIRHVSESAHGNTTWPEVFCALKETLLAGSPFAAGVFAQFADFLNEKGLSMLELEMMKSETVLQWFQVKQLEHQLTKIVERLRNQNVVKPIVGRNQAKPLDDEWIGVKGSNGFWAGFGFSKGSNPHLFMWVEICLAGDQRKLVETFDSEMKDAFTSAIHYVEHRANDESVNRGKVAKSGDSWFVFARTVSGELDGNGEAVFNWLHGMSNKAIALATQPGNRNA